MCLKRSTPSVSLPAHRLPQVPHAHQSSFLGPHHVSDLPLADGALVGHGAQRLLQRVLRVRVGQRAAPAERGQRVLEPAFLPDQRGDPGLGAHAASQGLQAQPPQLRRLVPALHPADAHLDRAGAGAGVQGAAEEPEGCGEEALLAGFDRA